MKRLAVTVLVVLGLVVAASASAAPRTASILIRHQLRGCHTWSVNGGRFAASVTVSIARGGTVTITNDDVMPHSLIKLFGQRVSITNGNSMPMGARMHGVAASGVMNHMGATTSITFLEAGTYRFKTRAGEDYMEGMRTIGEDNVLRLTVHVT